MKAVTLSALSLITGGALLACTVESGPSLDVPYVSTPQPVVEMMLDMVDLRDGDVVWDLGCGDGRMVITAAKRKNIRGVGVDLDPERIAESVENAKEAGVEDRVEFRVADLFETDFSEATVLTMYLLERVNRRLRPVILRDLAPGSRVVSHSFTMGEWPYDEMGEHDGGVFSRSIYHWVVPANLTGTWKWEIDGSSGTFQIDQKFQEFTGSATLGEATGSLKEGKLRGVEATFLIEMPGREASACTARAAGHTMTGSMDGRPWKATRDPATMVPLDSVKPDDEGEREELGSAAPTLALASGTSGLEQD